MLVLRTGKVSSAAKKSELLRKMKNGGGLEDISVTFLKLSVDNTSNTMCKLFSSCVVKVEFPKTFKEARVTSAYKKKANYI